MGMNERCERGRDGVESIGLFDSYHLVDDGAQKRRRY
jgi:hypothetical protein